MTRYVKILFLFGFFSIISFHGFSQWSVSYYSSSLSKVGVGYEFSERFHSELRLYSNTTFENITPEFVLGYNVVNEDKHKIYLGLGGNVNYFNGLVLPFGVRFTPVESLNRFSLHIEVQPTFYFERDVIIQSAWGIRYRFGK